MVDIRTYCHAARLAAFSCPQKHWNALIFRGALKRVNNRGPFYINGTPGADLGFSSGEVGGRASR
jgi:hypothetical protein